MSHKSPRMWIMKITPGGSGNTKKYFENLFVDKNGKNLIGYTKEEGDKIEEFSNLWKRIKIGDLVVVIEGFNRVFGVVEITSNHFDDIDELGDNESDWFFHRRKAELVKYFNPHIAAKSNTNRNTIIDYSGEGARDICDMVWEKIKDEYRKEKEIRKMQDKIELLEYKKQIILQGPPGTGKTRMAKMIAEEMVRNNKYTANLNEPITTDKKINLTPSLIESLIPVGTKIKGKRNKCFEVISFEKKTITIQSATSQPWTPSYNKIIKSFNEELYNISGRTGGYKSYEDAIAMYLKTNIDKTDISKIEEFEDENDFLDFVQIIQFHPSYTYEDFVRGIVAKSVENSIVYSTEDKILINIANAAIQDPNSKYVLIIDEINRANLPSVLGELIYALEYRGKEVNSLYEIYGVSRIELPKNLYIIGTMNTSDRSVGHIDYAIRRRFAFVDVLPNTEPIRTAGIGKFRAVCELFIENYDTIDWSNPKFKPSKHISSEFKPEDVMIGHSYFITKEKDEEGKPLDEIKQIELKLKYEIVPILKEYIKDGILKQSKEIETVINSL